MIKQYKKNNILVNFDVSGSGEPLVLLHGLNNNWQGGIPLIEQLNKKYQVIAVDLPGYGKSCDLDDPNPITMALIIKDFLDNYLETSAHLVGISFGSLVASIVAHSDQEQVKSLTMLGYPIVKTHLLSLAFKHFYKFLLRNPRLQPYYLKLCQTKQYGYFTARYINMYHFEKEVIDKYGFTGRKEMRANTLASCSYLVYQIKFNEILKNIDIPALFIWGDKDKLVDFKKSQRILTKLNKSNLQVKYLKNCGHSLHHERPVEASDKILHFLQN